MKNQLLIFALFALFVISNTQSTNVTVVANEEGTLIVTNEEAAVTAPPENTVINTTGTTGPTVTIQAPPVPANTSVPADDAASDLSDAASDLRDVNGAVVVTNPDGTASIVDASDLASDLSDQASDLSDVNGNVVVADGGNVDFVPLSAQTYIVSAGALAAGYLML